jgi:hypothetical protein
VYFVAQHGDARIALARKELATMFANWQR